MTSKISGAKPPVATNPVTGGGVIRPLYGVFIRDNLAQFKTQIGNTLSDTKKALATKGELTPAETTKAKAAVKHLDSAMKALKPVFKDLGAPATASAASGASSGTPIRPLYGVVFRDDLSNMRNEAQGNIQTIQAAINNGTLKGTEATEAKKALGYLNAAVRDLGAAPNPWE